MSFFKELEKLRGRIKTINAAVTLVGVDQISVIVTPKLDEKTLETNPQLGTPFVLTGTAEELDEHFAEQFTGFEIVRADVATQAKSQTQKLAAAKPKANLATPKPASTSTELGALLALGTSVTTEDEDDDVVEPTTTGAGAPAAPAASAPLTGADLFGGK